MKPNLRKLTGREQRRLEKRLANRKIRPARNGGDIPMLVKADYVLYPMDNLLTQIELRGVLESTEDGVYMFESMQGEATPLWGAVDGMAEFFDQWAIRNNAPLDVSPVRELAKVLLDQEAIEGSLLDRVRELMPRLRAIAGRLSKEEASSLLLNTKIRAELDIQKIRQANAAQPEN